MALRYNIKQAVERPKGTRILVPMNQPSLAFERAYRAELRRLLQGAAGGIRDIIIPSFQRSPLIATDSQLLGDADSAAFGSFTTLLNALRAMVVDRVRVLIGLEVKRHTAQWLKVAKQTFSIDLKGVVSEEGLENYLELAGLRNAGLIKGLTDDLVKRVQQDTLDALLNGESVATLKERIKHSLNVSDSRAQLIAYDQTSKINADLNKQRHKEAGFDHYIWRTSQDERVRARHRALEGKTYKYDEPTGAEDGLPPGQPIRCRCVAQAVVDFSMPEAVKPKQKMVAEEILAAPVTYGQPEFKGKSFNVASEMGSYGSGQVEKATFGSTANPIPMSNQNVYLAVGNKRFTKKWDDAFKEEIVPIETLQTVQSSLDKADNLKPVLDPSTLPPVKIARINGQDILLDGNHRAATLWLQGFKGIKASVIDLDDPKNASLINKAKLLPEGVAANVMQKPKNGKAKDAIS